MWDIICCNKEILKIDIHHATYKKKLNPNVKAELQNISAVRGNKNNRISCIWRDVFLDVLHPFFLNLGQFTLPSQAYQLQPGIQIFGN